MVWTFQFTINDNLVFFIFLKFPAVDMNVFSPWRELVAFQRDGDDARVSLGYSPLSFNLLCASNYELLK